MPKQKNGIGKGRLSVILYHIRRNTTSRSRRILLANIVCIILFLLAIGLAHRSPEVKIRPLPPTAGDVYYISKKALCANSIAHGELGIQPIAVSKVILRPVVREGEIEGYDDRLEVLEHAMINDVVFLDRNVTGNEAELSANVCPLHTISILPTRQPTRYSESALIFGVAISVDEIPQALQHWRYWARHTKVAFYILLPSTDYYRTAEAAEMVRGTLGINVHVEATRDTDDRAKMTLMLIEGMQKNAAARAEWFIILSPGTFVTSVDDMLLALEPYDASRSLYMGAVSESRGQREQWGKFAYGGAGIVLSRPLAETLAPKIPQCLEIDSTPYGDGLLGKCIGQYTTTDFTHLPTFHQCDVENDITGILQSSLEFATIYNLVPGAFPVFPSWHPVGPESSTPSTYSDYMDLFHLARKTLGSENWGIRYRFGKMGRYLLTNGYSITEFLRPPFPTNYDIRNGVEGTFSNENDNEEFTFHAIRPLGIKEIPMRRGLREGDDKRTYYLRSIEMTNTQPNNARGIKLNRNKREAAVFIYVNEWGNVRRGIEVVWLL